MDRVGIDDPKDEEARAITAMNDLVSEDFKGRQGPVGGCIDPRAEVQSGSGVGLDEPGSDG